VTIKDAGHADHWSVKYAEMSPVVIDFVCGGTGEVARDPDTAEAEPTPVAATSEVQDGGIGDGDGGEAPVAGAAATA
jgi:hypothetical protein